MVSVAVVGGGPAGLSLARSFRSLGLDCTVYERHGDVGGLWDPANRGTPMYQSAHFISSKTQSHYHDFPMPDHYPDYPSNRQILDYVRSFAEAFDLKRQIRFNSEVVAAEPLGDETTPSGWRLTLTGGETAEHDVLVCANGTNWTPSLPDYAGQFTGELRHSVTYASAEEFKGKRVLVIGGGNSGCDIACDAARTAQAAFISLRRGYHFIPKHLFGQPADAFAANGPQMPMWLEHRVFGALLGLLNGDLTRLGLQKPDHRIFETHPIMNTQLLHHLAHGDIAARPDVRRFAGQKVYFTDGSHETIDLIIAATGYQWSIPYVAADQFAWSQGRPQLYMNLFSRQNPRLYALGFMETNGGAYKLFDQMADLIGRAILARAEGGETARRFETLVAEDRPDLSGGIRFAGSSRHAAYVEIGAYRRQMLSLRKRLGWPDLEPGRFKARAAA